MGQAVKDVLKDMSKNKDQYQQKSRDEEIKRKMVEIYQPPGFVVTKETAVNRQSNIEKDIKNGTPNDHIHKRKKIEHRSRPGAKVHVNAAPPTILKEKTSVKSKGH